MPNVKKLVTASLFCALCCIMTMAVQIPSPMEGYVHLGDSMVLLAAFFLSPLYSALAAGIGSALADLFTGYTHYAVATFVIKALMALVAHYTYKAVWAMISKKVVALSIAAAAAECLMIVGYFFFAALLLGNGFVAAAASIPGNAMQAIFGAASSVTLVVIISKNKALTRGLS